MAVLSKQPLDRHLSIDRNNNNVPMGRLLRSVHNQQISPFNIGILYGITRHLY